MGNKILIVDDEPEAAAALRCVIEELGHQVKICDNGREVLDALRSYKPDLMILDIMLPGVDGYSLVAHISEGTEFNNMPVITVSALEVSRCMFQNFPQVSASFAKPFHIDDFTEAVRIALEKKK